MTAAAFAASYSDWKLIKTRSVVQVIFEVPLEAADAAYQVLDGMPNIGSERWFGIARLNPAAQERARPEAEPLPGGAAAVRAAGMLCTSSTFQTFLKEKWGGGWRLFSQGDDNQRAAEFVRWRCGVQSRSEIKTNPDALARWRELHNLYSAWAWATL
jgi:hypothetical protein